MLARLRPETFRVARPRRARDGRLVVDGWHAADFVAGEHRPAQWVEIVRTGEAFHRALTGEPRPSFLDRRVNRWAVADRVAWAEAPVDPYLGLPHVARLARARRTVDAAGQLIHGDLAPNVLFADGQAPAIIDVTLYWRPADYASAVVVADALVWEGAEASLVETVAHTAQFGQYLVRALIFRLLAERDPRATADRYAPAVDLALALGR